MDGVGTRPTADIDGCRSAHERLASALGSLTDEVARNPSLLPGWSVGHVLSHLARNAEAMVRRMEAAQRGETVEQYAGGMAGRAAEIDAGAPRPAEELIPDVLGWSERLDDTFAQLPDDSWNLRVRTVRGTDHPVWHLPFRRWREVEVHLVDLGIGFEPEGWPQEFVNRALPGLLADLGDRVDERKVIAWLLGRGEPPALESWG